jgi:tRNA(Arg) A34 adenosine deaminase TadA
MRTFGEAWTDLDPAARRSLELAYVALRAGGLAVGSVVTDAAGAIVAEGRNHAYDPPGGTDILQGTPLAHAELNALAVIRTERDLASCILWTTQEPCAMCLAAASFTGVGTIRFIAHDPWAEASGAVSAIPEGVAAPRVDGPMDRPWPRAANLLFLLSIAATRGMAHPTVVHHAERDPEMAAILIAHLASADEPDTLAEFLTKHWARIGSGTALGAD